MSTDPKSIDQIEIFKNDFLAGTLDRTREGCQIKFNEEFRAQYSLLTFTIPTDNPIYDYKGAGLPPYFAGLLPEGLRLRSLIKKTKTSPDDLFSLLAAAGSETIGDIHFRSGADAATLTDVPKDFKSLRAQLKKGIDPGGNSLAGIQDKVSADRLSLPIMYKRKSKSYILKLNSDDFPEVVANEQACLLIAKSCGLTVNASQIVTDQNQQQALLVERFDRQWNKLEKKWTRLHQEDACQFLNRYPGDKYLLSFQDIADQIAELVTTPEIEILNLMKLKAFSYLIGNGDLHGKNISLIQKSESAIITLSPIYDLVCTAIYGDTKMALKFMGKTENLKRKTFIEFGLRYQIPEVAVHSMLNKLTGLFAKNFEGIFTFPLAQKKEKFLRSFFTSRLKNLG